MPNQKKFQLPANARILSVEEAYIKIGCLEPCYEICRADGKPIMGAIYPLHPKDPFEPNWLSKDVEKVEPENYYWQHVYSRAENNHRRRQRNIYRIMDE
jgi:hypothetical protein